MSAATTAPGGIASRQRVQALASSLAAVVVGLVVGGGLILYAGGDPFSAYRALVEGAVGSPRAIGRMLTLAVPLIIIGLGLTLAFRARIYNIGAEGQLFMGALAGGTVAVLLPLGVGPLLIALAAAGGVVAGGAWAWIVGALRARWGVNEVITSLLLNFVAIYAFIYVVRRPLRTPGAAELRGREISEAAVLPNFPVPEMFLHIGIIVAILLVPVAAWVIDRTSFGFQVSMFGFNPEAAHAAGVRPRRLIIQLMVISGGLAGLAGVIQILGVSGRLDPGISQGYGFTAIIVALLGRLNAVGVLLAALFIAILISGGQSMSVTQGLPFAIVLAIPALFIVLLLIADRLARG